MKDEFKIIGIDDEFKSGNGTWYTISLKHIGGNDKYRKFGVKQDDEYYYSDTCWRVDIGLGECDITDLLVYVDNEGNMNEYGVIDEEFKSVLINYIKGDGVC